MRTKIGKRSIKLVMHILQPYFVWRGVRLCQSTVEQYIHYGRDRNWFYCESVIIHIVRAQAVGKLKPVAAWHKARATLRGIIVDDTHRYTLTSGAIGFIERHKLNSFYFKVIPLRRIGIVFRKTMTVKQAERLFRV